MTDHANINKKIAKANIRLSFGILDSVEGRQKSKIPVSDRVDHWSGYEKFLASAQKSLGAVSSGNPKDTHHSMIQPDRKTDTSWPAKQTPSIERGNTRGADKNG